jgi:hypothetical protein
MSLKESVKGFFKFAGQVAKVIVPLIAIVELMFILYTRERSEIIISGISRASLADINPEIRKHIGATFRGDTISNLTRFVFEIRNTGNRPVFKERFLKFPIVSAPFNGKFVDANIESQSYSKEDTLLLPVVINDGKDVEIQIRGGLEAGSWARIAIICINASSDSCRFHTLITGVRVKDVTSKFTEQEKGGRTNRSIWWWLGIIGGCLVLIFGIVFLALYAAFYAGVSQAFERNIIPTLADKIKEEIGKGGAVKTNNAPKIQITKAAEGNEGK